MLEKFLISIGLKQPEYIEEVVPENTRTVRPSSENRFSNEEYTGDLKIHQPKDEVEIKVLRSFSDSHLVGPPIKEGFIVAVDIRDIMDQNIRQRIVDFITGIAFISDAKMRIIHKDGVYLIIPSNMSLPSSERERLQSLGLYKINV
tara:strand:- start:485 stop:922 length:438 start_codon:yes stop_codon:yes gene_type:complete